MVKNMRDIVTMNDAQLSDLMKKSRRTFKLSAMLCLLIVATTISVSVGDCTLWDYLLSVVVIASAAAFLVYFWSYIAVMDLEKWRRDAEPSAMLQQTAP